MKAYNFSVCMATYNGAEFITEQIDSILAQMDENDELIISDDGSSDDTCEIVRRYTESDGRIKLVAGPKMGFSCNFGNAVANARNEIIVFTDQDDIWAEGKLSTIEECFIKDPECTTILHDMSTFITDPAKDEGKIVITYHSGVYRNLLRSSYWGCCMAVKREFINRFMPFPDYCVGHDQLTGIMSEKYGKTDYIDKKLIMHRIHAHNTCGKSSIKNAIVFRCKLFGNYRFANRKYKSFIKGRA